MRIAMPIAAFLILGLFAFGAAEEARQAALRPSLHSFVEARVMEFDQISKERKVQLEKIAKYVQERTQSGQPARLTFICTHNSRRSHMSQIWAAAAARHYGVKGVEVFSGGTEATAFNPRAVAALQRAGYKIEIVEEGKNPRFAVKFQETGDPLVCHSKVYNDPPNPKQDFCAVLTCSQADKACPVVEGAALRVAVPFEDPKVADSTPAEAATYDERCAQIAREMLYVYSQVEN